MITSTHNEIEEQYGLYNYYDPGRMVVIPPGTDMKQFRPASPGESHEFASRLNPCGPALAATLRSGTSTTTEMPISRLPRRARISCTLATARADSLRDVFEALRSVTDRKPGAFRIEERTGTMEVAPNDGDDGPAARCRMKVFRPGRPHAHARPDSREGNI